MAFLYATYAWLSRTWCFGTMPAFHICSRACTWARIKLLPVLSLRASAHEELLSTIAVADALAISHCRLRHHRPSQLPLLSAITIAMLLAISENCCQCVARIVFDQLKQRMLTLFYCVWPVGSALIKAGWLTMYRATMANTSIGWQAVSSERLVREVAGSRGDSRGAEGWRR